MIPTKGFLEKLKQKVQERDENLKKEALEKINEKKRLNSFHEFINTPQHLVGTSKQGMSIPFVGGISDFFSDISEPTEKILKNIPKILNVLPDIMHAGIETLEKAPEIIRSLTKLAEQLIYTMPSLLISIEKLLEFLLSGMEYTLDEKNKNIVFGFLIIFFIIWGVKGNSLIKRIIK